MEHTMADKSPKGNELECQETIIEIKVKTMDSQTYSLRVNKQMPVPELKEQIASVTGVSSERQRLICRGRVLKDDQLLSAYNVEDGHTLHLITREIVPPSSGSLSSQPDTRNDENNQVAPDVVEEDNRDSPNINRMISALVGIIGIVRDLHNARSRVPGVAPQVVPDSLTTLSRFLSGLRHYDFGGRTNNSDDANMDETQRRELNSASSSRAAQWRIPRLELLAELLLSTREMLINETAEDLLQLGEDFRNRSNLADPRLRQRTQLHALRTGNRFQNVGSFFMELGRTMMAVRLGRSRSSTVIDAGPSLFISPSNPNPVMVQTDSSVVDEFDDGWFLRRIHVELSRVQGPLGRLPDLRRNHPAASGRLTRTRRSRASGETQLTSDQIGINSVLESGTQHNAGNGARYGNSTNVTAEQGFAPAPSTRWLRLSVPSGETGDQQTMTLQEVYHFLQDLFPGGAIHVEEANSWGTSTDSMTQTTESTPELTTANESLIGAEDPDTGTLRQQNDIEPSAPSLKRQKMD